MKMNLTGAIEILKLHKHTTDKFKHSVGDQYVSDAIDTVLLHINTGNKTALDDRLQEKSIEQPDNQEGISNKKDRLYTAKDMEEFAEWCSYVPYAQVEGGRWANIKNLEIRTTAQLREQWEQERGEK